MSSNRKEAALLLVVAAVLLAPAGTRVSRTDNPIIKDVFNAAPAAMAHQGTVSLYTDHDAPGLGLYNMSDSGWRVTRGFNAREGALTSE